MATPAPACRKALKDATVRWPNRNRASDGIMGDPRHKARKSDHNLGNAYDLTHDPANGVDCNKLAKAVISDPRVKYVIWDRQIYNPSISKKWRKYSGNNPHTKHMHVSIKSGSRDDMRAWPWSSNILSIGSQSDDVKKLQQLLKQHFFGDLTVDGDFGPQTDEIVKSFQRAHGLEVDGKVGPNGETLKKLLSIDKDSKQEVAEEESRVAVVVQQAQSEIANIKIGDDRIKELQRVLFVPDDGIIGPTTIAAARNQLWIGYKPKFDNTVALKMLDSGRLVKWIQKWMDAAPGFSCVVDGDFGPQTHIVAERYFGKQGLVASDSVLFLASQ